MIAGMVALVACAKSATGPLTANVTGSWSGPISDAQLGSGTLSLSLTQVAMKSSNPSTCQFGPINLTASVSGTTSMSGTFATVPCAVSDSGTFTMVRQ